MNLSKLLLLSFIGLSNISLPLVSQTDQSVTVTLSVFDHYTNVPLESAHIEILHGGEVIESGLTDDSGNAGFTLAITAVHMQEMLPQTFSLSRNYPNPFDTDTNLELTVHEEQTVHVGVYNVLGQRVASEHISLTAGFYTLNVSLSHLPTGVYFLRAIGTESHTVKLVKTGNAIHTPAQLLSVQPGHRYQSAVLAKQSDTEVVIRAYMERYDTKEITAQITQSMSIDVPLERNNEVVFIVIDGNESELDYELYISGENTEVTAATPGAVILKSGFYSVVGSTDTNSVDVRVEVVSRDTTFVIAVDSDSDGTESLTVTVFLDEDSRVEKLISQEGGEISLTDALGNQYTLQIPEGALRTQERIIMTPVQSIDDLPMSGGIIGAVDLQPDGLTLLKGATLVVTPANPSVLDELTDPGSLQQLAGFAYRGDGFDFHLHPIFLAGDQVHFQIMRFSGYGAGSGSGDDIKNQCGRIPCDSAARYIQEIECKFIFELEDRWEEDPFAEITEQDWETLRDILRRWYQNSVKPLAEEAQNNDHTLECAFEEWMWWYERILYFFVPPWPDEPDHPFRNEIDEIQELLGTALVNAVNRTQQRCYANKDPSEFDYFIIWMEYLMWGLWPDITQAQIDEMMNEWISKCLRFELEFESAITKSEVWQLTVKSEKILLEHSPAGQPVYLTWTGSGSFQYTSAWWECITDFEGTGSDFNVGPALIGLGKARYPECQRCDYQKGKNEEGGDDNEDDPRMNVSISVQIGLPSEKFEIECPCDDKPLDFTISSAWRSAFATLHHTRLTDGGYLIDGWDMNSGEPYARKHFNQSSGNLNEQTVFTLWHSPLP